MSELDRPGVRLRPATSVDAQLVWSWRNDPTTREASFDSAVVVWESHLRWFSTALEDPCRHLLVVEVDSLPMGLLRFDALDDVQWEVSINLAPEARGRGLGATVLEMARTWPRAHGARFVVARVRASNTGSLRAFQSAGFTVVARHDAVVRLEAAVIDSAVLDPE